MLKYRNSINKGMPVARRASLVSIQVNIEIHVYNFYCFLNFKLP